MAKFAGVLREGERFPYHVTPVYPTIDEARKAGRALWFTNRFEVVELMGKEDEAETGVYEVFARFR